VGVYLVSVQVVGPTNPWVIGMLETTSIVQTLAPLTLRYNDGTSDTIPRLTSATLPSGAATFDRTTLNYLLYTVVGSGTLKVVQETSLIAQYTSGADVKVAILGRVSLHGVEPYPDQPTPYRRKRVTVALLTNNDYSDDQAVVFPVPYPTGALPTVVCNSLNPEYHAQVTDTSITELGFDITIVRRQSLENRRQEYIDGVVVTAGTQVSGFVTVNWSPVFQATPTVILETDNPDYVAVYTGKDANHVTFRVWYRPNARPGGTVGPPSPDQTDDNSDYSTGMYPTAGTVPASTTPLPTGGVNLVSGATPVTGDPNLIAGVSPTTGDQNVGHVHPENTLPGNTGDESVSHHHNVAGHQHDEGAHDHDTADHRHNLNNHNHTLSAHVHSFTGNDNNSPGDTVTVTITAIGTETSSTVTGIPVEYIAIA
jgi:hypothetical protein